MWCVYKLLFYIRVYVCVCASVYVCGLFVIECKVKGTPGRDRGERWQAKRGDATVPKAIPTQTDTILKLANGLHSVACCPICGPLFSGWYTDAPSEGTSLFQRGNRVGSIGGWGGGRGVWGSTLIYLQHVLHSSHNTVNYLHGQGSFLREGERRQKDIKHVIYMIFNSGITYDLSISIYHALWVIF